MRLSVAADSRAAAQAAATCIAAELRDAVARRGRARVAFSGGSTAGPMLELLGGMDLPWADLQVFQVDERVAPAGSEARNLRLLSSALPLLPESQLHAMPVEAEGSLEDAAEAYARQLRALAGTPPVLDLVHLGLGEDGHTASLFMSDPALQGLDREVGVTGLQRSYRRMTLSLPLLSRARQRVWLVSGASKALMLAALLQGPQPGIDAAPALCVARSGSVVFADRAAAALTGWPPKD